MSVNVVKVETRKQLKKFIRFNYELYKDCPYSVPELYEDTMNTLRKDRNAAFEFCDADYFLAYRDGEIVGRIAAIINRRANEKWGHNAVRFGWVDFIDDKEVADAIGARCVFYGGGSHDPSRLNGLAPVAMSLTDAVEAALRLSQS